MALGMEYWVGEVGGYVLFESGVDGSFRNWKKVNVGIQIVDVEEIVEVQIIGE